MEIAFLASLILFNGLFAMAEIAILTAKRVRLESAAERGDEGAVKRSSSPIIRIASSQPFKSVSPRSVF